jgi:hypothetical protein
MHPKHIADDYFRSYIMHNFSAKQNKMYCNRLYHCVARQQLCKHGPTCNNKGSCVFCRSMSVLRLYKSDRLHSAQTVSRNVTLTLTE